MFEKASRLSVRYKVHNGIINTEDLWGLGLSVLDLLARDLDTALRASGRRSFINENNKDEVLELKFEIVKHIIGVKLQEATDAKEEVVTRETRDKILNILEDKKYEKLKGMSRKELLKELEEL